MPRGLKRVGSALVLLLAALALAPTVVPPFLDRIYYRGPVTDHFDGRRFFNPDGGTALPGGRFAAAFVWRVLTRHAAARWPAMVPVMPGYPPAEAIACPITPARMAEAWARCVAHPDPRRMFVTWIGHSTALVQAGGITILTDPVYADRSGPWGLSGPKRVRAPGIRFQDLPRIDLVLVSHNHYDHMDLATLRRLWARDRPLIVTSLGNDTILRGAGVPSTARDWGGRVAVRPGVTVIVERVHHWGTRWGADRNRSLWSGFTVTLPGGNLFFAGDTAWGDGSWPGAAARHGPFRLAILPIGAIRPRELMAPNHIDPTEAVAAFRRLGATYALGVHWGTFHLTEEEIDAPPRLLAEARRNAGIAPDRFRATEVGRPWEIPRFDDEDGSMLTGTSHCGAAQWTLEGDPGRITACNRTLCRRYGVLWAYDHVDERIGLTGRRGLIRASRRPIPCWKPCSVPTAPACWPGAGYAGRRTGACAWRSTRGSPPTAVAHLPIDHFNGRCVRDLWF